MADRKQKIADAALKIRQARNELVKLLSDGDELADGEKAILAALTFAELRTFVETCNHQLVSTRLEVIDLHLAETLDQINREASDTLKHDPKYREFIMQR